MKWNGISKGMRVFVSVLLCKIKLYLWGEHNVRRRRSAGTARGAGGDSSHFICHLTLCLQFVYPAGYLEARAVERVIPAPAMSRDASSNRICGAEATLRTNFSQGPLKLLISIRHWYVDG